MVCHICPKICFGWQWETWPNMLPLFRTPMARIERNARQRHEPPPQIYSVKAVAAPETPMILISVVARPKHFEPWKIRAKVIEWLEHLHPSANPNRGRLSGTPSLTFGAQTGRGSDRSCVIKRTTDYQLHSLISLVHQLAKSVVGPTLPY